MPLHRDRRQPQPGGPALRPLGEAFKRVLPQGNAVLGHEQSGLGHAERELVGPDLRQLAAEPEPVQRQERVDPRGRHHLQALRCVPHEVGQSLQGRALGQQMEIVQDQDDRRPRRGERGGEPDEELVVQGVHTRRRPGRVRHRDARPSQGGRDVAPQHPRPVVELVQGDPCHPGRGLVPGGPRGHGQGLAHARRAHQRRQRPLYASGDHPVEPRPRDGPVRRDGHCDLGSQDRHVRICRSPGTFH